MSDLHTSAETLAQLVRAAVSLGLVIVLLLGFAWLVQRLQGRKLFGQNATLPLVMRLKLENVLHLDPKTRLVLVRRGETGHLLCLGAQGATLLESGIPLPPEPAPVPATEHAS